MFCFYAKLILKNKIGFAHVSRNICMSLVIDMLWIEQEEVGAYL